MQDHEGRRVVPAQLLEDVMAAMGWPPVSRVANGVRTAIGPQMPCCGGYAWQHRKVSLMDDTTSVLCPITERYETATADYLAWAEAQQSPTRTDPDAYLRREA